MSAPFSNSSGDQSWSLSQTASAGEQSVLRLRDCDSGNIRELLGRWGLELALVAEDNSIPGSFWGDEEAGLVGNRLYARADTPLHSLLHEAGHFVCMDAQRRDGLDTNAGGDYDEENAVCYLQVLAASRVPECGRGRMFADMDAWGYSFRLGSTSAWFEQDADEAREWLISQRLIDNQLNICWRLRN